MLKQLLLLPLAALSVLSAAAQFRYTLKDTATPYVPLSGAASMNGSLVWDEEIVYAPMPFTWTMNGEKTTNYFYLALEIPAVLADTTNFGSIDGFILADIDIADRGSLTGAASLSPIRYLTAGSAPNRIFKVELANAGIFDELGNHGSMDDSIDMQIWIYETSNIVEYHFGPSKITYPSEYYGFGGSGPFMGYAKSTDFVSGNSGKVYFLTGSQSTPSLDTLFLPPAGFPSGLTAWPSSGQVYRFTPVKPNVGVPTTVSRQAAIRVYPSVTSSLLNVQYVPGLNETAEYQISSVTGAVVARGRLQPGLHHIDVSAVAAGTYHLQVRSKNTSGTYYFVKQ